MAPGHKAQHKPPYKLIAFDLDGTLALSKGIVSSRTASLLYDLSQQTQVTIISGGSFAQFEKQVLVNLKPTPNIILLPAEGSERFEYDGKGWKITDRQVFPEELKKEVIKILNEIISSGSYDIPTEHTGSYIEDRDTEIAFSALGQQATLEEKEKWDPGRTKRQKIKEILESRISAIDATIAGTTSIDILPKGFDKAKGLALLTTKLGIEKKDIVFVGDAIVPGANDYSVFQAGIQTLSVNGPDDTDKIIEKWLDEGKTTDMPVFPANPIAFFCSEYALSDDPTMYAGGLGVLAGDYLLEIAHQNLPFVGIGLKYGDSKPEGFSLLNITIDIPIGTEKVSAKVWHSALAPNVHLLLLDAGSLTANLYDMDFYTRVKQQMVLGIGGLKLLNYFKIFPHIYHLNEGHTAFGALAIMVERPKDVEKIVATKHTILSEAGILIHLADFKNLFGPYCQEFGIDVEEVFEKGKFELNEDMFSTTKILMTLAVRKNGVSVIHTVFEKKKHPHSQLIAITNGVYRKRWQAPELFSRSKAFSDEDMKVIKRKLRLNLFHHIENVSGKVLNPDICTLVWARRFAGYKRPYLLFSDHDRLMNIISNPDLPLQIVISGKAHKADKEGQEIVSKIVAFSEEKLAKNKVVYLPNYSLLPALKLVQGADIWLNTPELGKEACGTSGMKAALNGALQCSIPDGWVDEVSLEGIGWSLPPDNTAEVLYDLLEQDILPCYYGEDHQPLPHQWLGRMKATMELVEKTYTTERMLEQYRRELYFDIPA